MSRGDESVIFTSDLRRLRCEHVDISGPHRELTDRADDGIGIAEVLFINLYIYFLMSLQEDDDSEEK